MLDLLRRLVNSVAQLMMMLEVWGYPVENRQCLEMRTHSWNVRRLSLDSTV